MDTGIAGFVFLLLVFAGFLWYLSRRYRAVEEYLYSQGFQKVDDYPGLIKTQLDKIISREPEACYSHSNTQKQENDTWIIQLKSDPADEDSTVECAIVMNLNRMTKNNFILRGFSGADTSSLLGKAAVHLSELETPTLKSPHRLDDPNKLLSFKGYGFIAYSQTQTDLEQLLPKGLVSLLKDDTARRIWHLAVEDNSLIVHTSWSDLDKLLDFAYKLRQAIDT